MNRYSVCLLALALAGCEDLYEEKGGDSGLTDAEVTTDTTATDTTGPGTTETGTTETGTTGTTGTGTTGTTGTTETGTTDAEGWVANLSPCTGSKLDTLECDDASTCYVGCGSNAVGDGLFVTTDGGSSWDIAPDAYGGFFETWRVHDLFRDPGDGLLYVAGIGDDDYRVVSLDTATGELGEVYNNNRNIDYSMSVGSYARRSDGLEVAESLTGNQVIVRYPDADFQDLYADFGGWGNGAYWWQSTDFTSNTQVLDMAVVNDHILGVGSQINVPPAVLLPPRDWDFAVDDGSGTFDMWETVSFAADGFGAYDGECWGIDGNADGLAVVCVNQDADKGMVYTIGSDWETTAYEPSNWTATSFDTVVAAATVSGHSTWNEGVCRGPGNRVAVVGRDSQTDDGYVAYSEDGGESWQELTAEIEGAFGVGLGPVTECSFDDTHLMVAGPGLYAYAPLTAL